MASFYPKPKGKPDKEIRQLGLLVTIPAIMLAAPVVGYFIGGWADRKLGTEPYLLIGGVFLGLAAAGVEVYRILRQSSALDKTDEDENGL